MPSSTPDRLSDALLKDISHKNLPAGTKLPSFRKLARQFGVSLPTMQRAITSLEKQGFLNTVHGSGTFVTGRTTESGPSTQSSVVIAAFPFQGYGPELLVGLQRKALSMGLLMTQWFSDQFAQDLAFEKQLINHARKEKLRAILLFTSPKLPTNDGLFQEVKKEGVRIVHLAQYKEDMQNEEFVRQDFRRGGAAGATYLLRKGYTRFVTLIIGGTPDYYGKEIREGFDATIRDQGISSDLVRHLNRTPPYKLPELEPGTGILCDRPFVAQELLVQIDRKRLRIPQDVGVIAYGNVEYPQEYPVPCIRFGQAAIITAALDCVLETNPSKLCQILIPPADLVEPKQGILLPPAKRV